MDLFKQVMRASKKQFSSTEIVRHKYVWECTRCKTQIPASYKVSKLQTIPPVLCTQENCSGSTFKLITVE